MDAAPREVFLFPLNTVLFPGGVLPLKVFEQRYIEMTKLCLRDSQLFGVCLIKEGREVGSPAVPEPAGCYARITDWDMPQLGMFQLRTMGTERFRVVTTTTAANGLIRATVTPFPPESTRPPVDPVCRQIIDEILHQTGDRYRAEPGDLDNASWVSFRLAEFLPLANPVRQALLELQEPAERMARLREEIGQMGLLQ